MRTYERNGVHIEQCDNCRGIFLDYGELETLTRMESQYNAAPRPRRPRPGLGRPAPRRRPRRRPLRRPPPSAQLGGHAVLDLTSAGLTRPGVTRAAHCHSARPSASPVWVTRGSRPGPRARCGRCRR
ncbi:zf-TFIIB domain-containing protein [Nonomuraea thailandensis]